MNVFVADRFNHCLTYFSAINAAILAGGGAGGRGLQPKLWLSDQFSILTLVDIFYSMFHSFN